MLKGCPVSFAREIKRIAYTRISADIIVQRCIDFLVVKDPDMYYSSKNSEIQTQLQGHASSEDSIEFQPTFKMTLAVINCVPDILNGNAAFLSYLHTHIQTSVDLTTHGTPSLSKSKRTKAAASPQSEGILYGCTFREVMHSELWLATKGKSKAVSVGTKTVSIEDVDFRLIESVKMRGHVLDNIQPAPFLKKTYDLVNDPRTDAVISWGPENNSFVVWEPAEFSRDLLPRSFKHNNFSSFGFRKIDPDRWEFSNENFIRGCPELLVYIQRKRPATNPDVAQNSISTANSAIEIGLFGGLRDEVANLKRDKNVLMLELVRLRQQQTLAEKEIRKLQKRLDSGEARQAELLHVFTQYLQSPEMLAQLLNRAKRRSIEAHDHTGHHRKSSPMDELKLIPYHREKEGSPPDVTARLDHLLGSFVPEDNPYDFQPYSNGLRTIAGSPAGNGQTVMGTPVIPDSMPASEFLARTTPAPFNPDFASPPQLPIPKLYAESMDPYAADETDDDDVMAVEGDMAISVSTPFATEDAQTGDFASSFPMPDVDMQLTDRYESDEYWKRFIVPASTPGV